MSHAPENTRMRRENVEDLQQDQEGDGLDGHVESHDAPMDAPDEARRASPGPGEYQHRDPSRPTVDSTLSTAKGKGTGAFASTTLRDLSQWKTTSGSAASCLL